jgi:thiol-disulfide isomerase/thioredoxin
VPAERLVKELKPQYEGRVAFDVVDVSKDFDKADRYGIQSTPTFVIVGRDGSVEKTLVGPRDRAEIVEELDKAVSE